MDPLEFRLKFLRNDRVQAVLDKVAEAGDWGRSRCRPAPRRASRSTRSTRAPRACLVEIDCRPATVNRQIRDAVTGPRVTRVVFAVDAGLAINPRGLEAQMQGGFTDGIALALT